MCLAIPAKIVEVLPNGMARAQIGESSTYIPVSTLLLPEPSHPGDYVIVHAGFALHRLEPEDAHASLASLREIAEAIDGKPANF